MPSIISALLREQIRLVKPILTKSSIAASRSLQEALGELEEKAVSDKVDFQKFDISGIPAAWAVPTELSRSDRRVALYLHGGGYVAGSINYARGFAGVLASKAQIRTMCIAYRLAPEYPYPAALEDAVAAYEYLLSAGYRSKDIYLIGESAGGGLVFALCLALKAQGKPLPARIVALSPWTDLTMSGVSYKLNRKLDVSLTAEEIEGFVEAYSPTDQQNPLVSPLFGELEGLPPTMIYAGGDEILLSDSRMMAERLFKQGVPCRLTIDEGMWHAYVLYGVPESNEALFRIREFFEERVDE